MNTITKTFGYKREDGQNPYTGFMSFQHFRGEELYSDIVVDPMGDRTETERVECYPISHDAEENGRSEGYYPDSSLVYIRVLWKEFEPRQGEYNYKFIEDIIEKTKAHDQQLAFRFMAHSTRASDDVPEWLKSLIKCPERPDGERVKDSPTDPLFMELFLKAVRKLGERFDSCPELYSVDISLPGAWGEGHNLELYADNILEVIVDTYTAVFKNTQLMTQLIRPNLIEYAKKSAGVDLGWRGDGLGDPFHINEFYPPRIETLSENWRIAPVSFESYWWLGEWERRGWDIDRIIEKTLDWHISSFNGKSMPVPLKWRDKIDFWVSHMGYHFTLNSITCPDSVKSDEELSVALNIENIGVAPVYGDARLYAKLKSENDSFVFPSTADIRGLLPGKHRLSLSGILPAALAKGEYTLEIKLQFDTGEKIYLASDTEADGEWYKLTNISLT